MGDAGDSDGGLEALPFPEVFPNDELLDVALELRDEDWDRLRSEGRTLNEVFSGCSGTYAYTLMDAEATIDDRSHGHLQMRKKGFLGSLSTSRPSLRLEFGDDRYRGRKELTLNNNRSDSALVRQCLAYQVFEKAGFAAPYCAFADVRVNGERLGTYTNVEAIKRGLLKRYFESADGNLYEGNARADFRAGALKHFERKNNREHPEIDELEAVTAALEIPDDSEMVAALEPLIDLDGFIRFWATEVLVGHWDGYVGNTNNFYVYREPSSNKLVFIPWGTDGAFVKNHAFLPPTGRPPVTLALARLPRRLYAYEPTRERYYAQLRELLEHVWDESHLLGEIDRMSALLDDGPEPAAIKVLREFIVTRRGEIEQELSAAPVPWSIPERSIGECTPDATSKITGTFSTTWGTLDTPFASGSGSSFEVEVNRAHRSMQGVSGAGPLEGQRAAVRLLALLEDGRYLVVHFELPTLPHDAPIDVPLHGFETNGVVVVAVNADEIITLGYVGTGTIHFDQASIEEGGAVSGSFEAQFTQNVALAALQP